MTNSRRVRVTYSGVASTLALAIALGSGGAYAATLIGTAQIKNGAVTNPKIAANAVGTAKIANSAVGPAKIANNAVGTAKIANNAVGPAKIANGAVGSGKLDAATRAAILPPWGVIPSGKTVVGAFSVDTHSGPEIDRMTQYLVLPASAPVQLSSGTVGFGAAFGITASPQCPGTAQAPAPAPGAFCVYVTSRSGFNAPLISPSTVLGGTRVVFLSAQETAVNADTLLSATWAYTAP